MHIARRGKVVRPGRRGGAAREVVQYARLEMIRVVPKCEP
jgi:hypothetical protein